MPAQLEAYWRAHPERWTQRPRHYHGFPAKGTQRERIDWFRGEFLKLAEEVLRTKNPGEIQRLKQRGEFLKLAFTATLKGENAGGSDEAMDQYAAYLSRRLASLEAVTAEHRTAGDAKNP
jgi:hypothetical protein